jgi:tRNA (guanine-N7-)-methyltransferase
MDFGEIFGNRRAVELEIGTGKGGFLLEQARRNPERNYFGVEWAREYFEFAARRMARHGLTNVRMCRTDAKVLVMRCLPESSLAALHVYHPDPWPKRRHHKRRLFDEAFVQAVARVLADGATVSWQTDHIEYGQVIQRLLAACPELEQTLALENNCQDAAEVVTNYQIKYRREGRVIRRQTHRRRPRSSSAP